jgi:hypothetical protein
MQPNVELTAYEHSIRFKMTNLKCSKVLVTCSSASVTLERRGKCDGEFHAIFGPLPPNTDHLVTLYTPRGFLSFRPDQVIRQQTKATLQLVEAQCLDDQTAKAMAREIAQVGGPLPVHFVQFGATDAHDHIVQELARLVRGLANDRDAFTFSAKTLDELDRPIGEDAMTTPSCLLFFFDQVGEVLSLYRRRASSSSLTKWAKCSHSIAAL